MFLHFLLDLDFLKLASTIKVLSLTCQFMTWNCSGLPENAFQRLPKRNHTKALLKQVPLCHSSIEPCTPALEKETGR